MLWLLTIPIVATTALVWACCAAGRRDDDASDVAFGDVANLPRGLIRKRAAEHRQHTGTDGRENLAAR